MMVCVDYFDLNNLNKNLIESNTIDALGWIQLNCYKSAVIVSLNKNFTVLFGSNKYIIINNILYFPIFPQFQQIRIKLNHGIKI
jgi:hypothetical protein